MWPCTPFSASATSGRERNRWPTGTSRNLPERVSVRSQRQRPTPARTIKQRGSGRNKPEVGDEVPTEQSVEVRPLTFLSPGESCVSGCDGGNVRASVIEVVRRLVGVTCRRPTPGVGRVRAPSPTGRGRVVVGRPTYSCTRLSRCVRTHPAEDAILKRGSAALMVCRHSFSKVLGGRHTVGETDAQLRRSRKEMNTAVTGPERILARSTRCSRPTAQPVPRVAGPAGKVGGRCWADRTVRGCTPLTV